MRLNEERSVVPRPAFGNGLVFVSSGYDTPVTYAIRPDGTGDVTKTHVAWTLAKGAPLTPSPLVVGDARTVMCVAKPSTVPPPPLAGPAAPLSRCWRFAQAMTTQGALSTLKRQVSWQPWNAALAMTETG